ncbi:MAG: hypothetical protein NVSMB49_13810 [Ktedonobacteraceae bacterium]
MRMMFKWYERRRPSLIPKGVLVMFLLVLVMGSATFASASAFSHKHPFGSVSRQKTLVTNGADQWNNDTQTTPLVSSLSLLGAKHFDVSPLFSIYYQHRGTRNSLGNPLTPAFPIDHGWLQFFEAGALFLPVQQQYAHIVQSTGTMLSELVNTGIKDPVTDVVRISFLQRLLTSGSLAPIGGEGSSLTYVDLRTATHPNHMVAAQVTNELTAFKPKPIITNSQGMFVKGGMRAGENVGHVIAQPFWSYINRSDIAPDGWQEDIGIPLTEALPFTMTYNGNPHHMLVQVFSLGGLLFDQDIPAISDQPSIYRLNTGLDYLHTFGLPDVKLDTKQEIWSQEDTSLLDAPETGNEIAHVGQHFPLLLTGDTAWSDGMLWYHVQWTALKDTYNGWIDADTVTFTLPTTDSVSQTSFDAFSPDLTAYLNDIGPNASAVLYDVTHQIYYTYNSSTQFIVASSMKVPIMFTFLDMVEQQGRDPDDNEMVLLTTMIENSNNDSASALFSAIGGADGVTSYMQKIGVTGLSPDNDSWGYSVITPQAMVDMLTLLYQGKILNAAHRSLAFDLMENIEPDQQVGVGDTAPNGAVVAMKDGWVTGPDGQWAMNSSGIVTVGNETYILAVYTQEQPSLEDGQAITRHVCGSIASLLNS